VRLEFEIITPMHVQNSIFIVEVFQIEVSDGLVHSRGSCQNVNLYPARVFMGARVLRTLHTLQFEMITPMCVQSSMLIGEVFPIEVLDGSNGPFPWKLSKSKLVSS